MPELTDLQQILLEVLSQFAEVDMLSKTCSLTNDQLFNKMRIRPGESLYITRLLKSLEKKGKIKINTKYLAGNQGLKRVITIL